MSNGPRVLVLVLSADREPWRSIELHGQRETWAAPSELDDQLPVRYFYGRPGLYWPIRVADKAVRMLGRPQDRRRVIAIASRGRHRRPAVQQGDRIMTAIPESWLGIAAKTKVAFRHVVESEDFDFLLRTNTSTYVNRPRLAGFVRGLPTSDFYGGYLHHFGPLAIAAGTGILMSRDVVETAAYAEDFALAEWDDGQLGMCLHRRGVKARSLHRLEFRCASDVEQYADRLPNYWHIRCKSGPNSQRNDVAVMHRIHQILTAER